jgi:hypothetical protein
MFIFLSAVPVFAQNQNAGWDDLWVSAVAESSYFSKSNAAFGFGAAIGYGDGMSFGLRLVFFSDVNEVNSLEINFLLRLYLPRLEGHSGLFVQFNGGPVLFAQAGSSITRPAQIGTFSAGLSVGWRFLFGRYFYLEPFVRAGTPYLFGAGLHAGVRF